jgi:hypothetical protein
VTHLDRQRAHYLIQQHGFLKRKDKLVCKLPHHTQPFRGRTYERLQNRVARFLVNNAAQQMRDRIGVNEYE